MRRFAYVCGDRGVPLPGCKGAANHVASVVRAFTNAGLAGEVLAARPTAELLEGVPLRPLGRPAPGADFVYERYSLWHTAGLTAAREIGRPFVLEVNAPLPDEAARFRGLERTGAAERVAARLMRGADGIVCVSKELSHWVARRRGSAAGVWTIPNGVDARRFSRERALQETVPFERGRRRVVAFCGSFRPWHGLDDLAGALAMLAGRFPDLHLLCIGDGPTREAFEGRMEALGLRQRLTVSGMLPQREVPGWLVRADIAVAPYPALEQFYFSPLKLYEFMALGLPVVAGARGQVRALLGDGRRGRLYPPGDAAALAAALAELLERPRLAATLAAEAQRWVLRHATWERRVGTILDKVAALEPLRRAAR